MSRGMRLFQASELSFFVAYQRRLPVPSLNTADVSRRSPRLMKDCRLLLASGFISNHRMYGFFSAKNSLKFYYCGMK